MASPESVLALIKRRRSVKPAQLKADAVPREVLNDVLEAACWAPSHGQTEPWRFTVFAGDARQELAQIWATAYKLDAEAKGTFDQAQYDTQLKRPMSAPVWIALGLQPAAKPDGTPAFPIEEESQAVACAVQNLHLMATAHGLAGQWTTGKAFLYPNTATALGLVSPAKLVGFFFLGYPSIDWPTGKRAEMATRVRWA